MPIRLNEDDIKALIQEEKRIPLKDFNLSNMKSKAVHLEKDIQIEREDGSLFRIKIRKNSINPHHYSIILGYCPPNSNSIFRLIRFNSKHLHKNKIENEYFNDFHIHIATERYQDKGFKPDAYAKPTDRYNNFNNALDCFINEINIIFIEEDESMRLF